MKKIILVLSLILLSHITIAQNVTMAKAFYKKAQKEYENKNYKEVIILLEKTVENLNGETNPDIMYLEAKSRIKYDKNILKAKNLINDFLKTTDEVDARRDEVAQLLVEIEINDNYFDNGEPKKEINKYPNHTETIYYDKLGQIVNKKIKYGEQISNHTYHYLNERLDNIKIYVAKELVNTIKFYYSENKKKVSVRVRNNVVSTIRIHDPNTEEVRQKYGPELLDNTYNDDTSTGLISSRYSNDIINQIHHLKIFKKKKFFKVIETYPLPKSVYNKLKGINENIGMIKKLKVINEQDAKYYHIYKFDDSGIPTNREYYKKNNLLITETYNKNSMVWK